MPTSQRLHAIVREAFRVNPDAMCIATVADGRFIEVNEGFLRIFVCTRDRAVGHTVQELGIWPSEDERAVVRKRLIAEREIRDVELTLRRSTGELFPVEASSVTLDVDAELCVLSVIKDVSDRKRAEQELRDVLAERTRAEEKLRESEGRFRAFAESSRATIGVSGGQRFIYVNPRLAELTGYTQTELLTMEAWSLVDPAFREAVGAQTEPLRRSEEMPRVYEAPLLTKHGERRWVEAASTPLELAGKPCTLTMGLDVTERKRAEQSLRDAEVALRQTRKMEVMGRLAGGVAHDFNNLLTVIVGHSDLLMTDLSTTDPRRESVAAIAQAADRATRLTRQLLAFSRRDVVSPRVVNANQAVTKAQQLFPHLIGENIRVEVNLDPDIANIRVDPDQLEQVLMNLAVNARDAMPDGGVLCIGTTSTTFDDAFVHAHPGAKTGAYVSVSVSDTGDGMDDDTAAQVFEPFYTTKTPSRGTGLGLATVYGIVEQCGGYITLETAPGHGATFTVSFPQVDVPADAAPKSRLITGPVRGSETVVLVEDEDLLRDLLSRGLRALGYTVLAARDGPEALAVCGGTAPIDLLLTDVVMPGMNGRELSEQLTTRYPGLPTLYMSGYADNILGHQGLRAVEAELLRKPFTPHDAARKIRQTLDDA